jgi:thymidine phosphorylase
MKSEADARALADAMVRVGNGAGVVTSAFLTDMEQPLGEACGNALEVRESIACLQGGGPADLRDLTVALAGHPRAAEVLASGRAYERFARMVAAHGGDLARLGESEGVETYEVTAPRGGVLTRCDALEIGRAAFVLGAGRLRADDPVHPGVGVTVLRKIGDPVEPGQPLARVHHAGKGREHADALLAAAFVVGDTASARPMVRGVLG